MASALYIILTLSTLCIVTLADDANVTAPKKKVAELWYFSPLTALILVKFKLLFIAFLVLTGTASITRFIAGLVRILAGSCKQSQQKPIYVKYESPSSHGHYHSYYGDNDLYYHSKKAVDRAVRGIDNKGK